MYIDFWTDEATDDTQISIGPITYFRVHHGQIIAGNPIGQTIGILHGDYFIVAGICYSEMRIENTAYNISPITLDRLADVVYLEDTTETKGH